MAASGKRYKEKEDTEEDDVSEAPEDKGDGEESTGKAPGSSTEKKTKAVDKRRSAKRTNLPNVSVLI